MLIHPLVLFAVYIAIAVSIGDNAEEGSTVIPEQTQSFEHVKGEVPGKSVYFVPLGEYPNSSLKRLQKNIMRELDLKIKLLPPIPLTDKTRDANRQQVVAEELTILIEKRRPRHVRRQDAVVIGVTDTDMYIRGKPDWRFAFAYSVSGGGLTPQNPST